MKLHLFNATPWIERSADITALPEHIFSSDTSFLFLNDQLNAQRRRQITEQLNQFLHSSAVLNTPSVLIPTSGTTSHLLKIVVFKKQNFLRSAKKANAYLKSGTDDKWLVSLPLHHVAGLSILARAFLNHNKTYYWAKWDPKTFIKNLNEWSIQFCSLVPTQIFDLVSQNLTAPKSLKTVLVGGSAFPDSHWQRMKQLGWPLLKTYGMTETAAFISTNLSDTDYYDPLPGIQVRLDSDNRLAIKTDSLFDGYIVQTDTEQWQFQTIRQHDGYWSTEDHATLKGHQFQILGRDQGLIKVKGELVNTQTLNQRLWEISEQIDATAPSPILYFFPSERDGYELFAIFEKGQNEGHLKTVIKRLNEHVLPYERINWYIVVDEIPKTDLGKIKTSSFNTDSFKEIYFENRQSIF